MSPAQEGKTSLWAGRLLLGCSWPLAKVSLSQTLDMKSLSIRSAWHDSPATFASTNASLNGHSLMRPFVHRGEKRHCRRTAHLPNAAISIHHKGRASVPHHLRSLAGSCHQVAWRNANHVNTHCRSLVIEIDKFSGCYRNPKYKCRFCALCLWEKEWPCYESPGWYYYSATLQHKGATPFVIVVSSGSSRQKTIVSRHFMKLLCGEIRGFQPVPLAICSFSCNNFHSFFSPWFYFTCMFFNFLFFHFIERLGFLFSVLLWQSHYMFIAQLWR